VRILSFTRFIANYGEIIVRDSFCLSQFFRITYVSNYLRFAVIIKKEEKEKRPVKTGLLKHFY